MTQTKYTQGNLEGRCKVERQRESERQNVRAERERKMERERERECKGQEVDGRKARE